MCVFYLKLAYFSTICVFIGFSLYVLCCSILTENEQAQRLMSDWARTVNLHADHLAGACCGPTCSWRFPPCGRES